MIRDLGLLAVRAVLGLSFASHGAQKAFGAFEGPGPEGAAQFLEGLGFKPGARFGALTSYSEMTAGLLVALGLGGAVGPAMICAVMVVAQTTVHAKNGFFAQKQGVELGVLYATAAVAVALAGPGRLSLDSALRFDRLADERLTLAILAAGALGGVLALGQREAAEPER